MYRDYYLMMVTGSVIISNHIDYHYYKQSLKLGRKITLLLNLGEMIRSVEVVYVCTYIHQYPLLLVCTEYQMYRNRTLTEF